jgi:hypothetical protein
MTDQKKTTLRSLQLAPMKAPLFHSEQKSMDDADDPFDLDVVLPLGMGKIRRTHEVRQEETPAAKRRAPSQVKGTNIFSTSSMGTVNKGLLNSFSTCLLHYKLKFYTHMQEDLYWGA